MKLQNASLRPTKSLELPSTTRLVEPSAIAYTAVGNVVYKEFYAPAPKATLQGSVDVDDLIAEFASQSVEHSDALAKGRKWVAKSFYADVKTIAQLRLKKGWSQAELAKRAETSQPYIARLELGNVDPQMSTARKIAKVLGVSIEEFDTALQSEIAK